MGKIILYPKEGSIEDRRNQCPMPVNKLVNKEQTDNLNLGLTQAGSHTGHWDMWLIWPGFVYKRTMRASTRPGMLCEAGWSAAHGTMLNPREGDSGL